MWRPSTSGLRLAPRGHTTMGRLLSTLGALCADNLGFGGPGPETLKPANHPR